MSYIVVITKTVDVGNSEINSLINISKQDSVDSITSYLNSYLDFDHRHYIDPYKMIDDSLYRLKDSDFTSTDINIFDYVIFIYK